MKVIRCDNFARESVAEKLVKEGLTDSEARRLAEELNEEEKKKFGDHASDFYKAVMDNYVLWRGMEDLV